MHTLHLNCRTCEFFSNGICMNHKSDVGYNQSIEHMSAEGKPCWSISLDYFTTLVNTLPIKEQWLVKEDEHITVYELLERVETGIWNREVLRRMEARRFSDKNSAPTLRTNAAFI